MPLSIVLWLPLAAAVLGAFLPPRVAPRALLAGSLATVVLAVILLVGFHSDRAGLQHVTDELWIPALGVHYKLGLDGLNLFLVLLTTILFFSAVLYSNFRTWERPRLFYFQLGLAESAVLGAFFAQDLILFVVFFDLMLIPFYFLIGAWGGRNRVAATTKLVIYTLVGSLFMLVGAVAAGVLATHDGQSISFALSDLQARGLSTSSQEWIFLCFAAAFLVKMPAFPFHAWMPDGYRAMPIPVLAVFSGVLSKVAAYGFLRVVLPIFPDASVHFQELMLLIALASILYGSALAFTSTNLRLIAGYSSIAQLGFITLGIFALRSDGGQGAVLQMVNHGIVVAPFIFTIGLLAARAGGSEDIRDMGGMAKRAPVLAALFLIVSFATLAMPGSSNFVGEFLILLGVFQTKLVIAIVAFAGVVAASVYMLRAFIRTMHNRLGTHDESREIGFADGLVLVPLVLCILGLALYPQLALHRSQETVKQQVRPAQIAASGAPQQSADAGATP